MKLKERLEAVLKEARAIAAKAEEEARDFTPEERELVKAKLEEARTLKADASLLGSLEDFGDDVKAIDGAGSVIDDEKAGRIAASRRKSLGEAFVEHEAYNEWLKRVAPNGLIPESAKGITSPAFEVPGLKGFGYRPSGMGAKDLVTGASATSAGALIAPDFLGLQDEGTYARPLTLLDVLTRGTTDGDTVEYARVTGVTNSAAPVAEATATGGSSGTKPESAMTLEKVTAAVKTIAHWIPATKRALSDAGQLRTLIDNFLLYGLSEELEDQVVNGDGTGENFTGILNTTGVQTQAFDTDQLVTIRKAKTLVKVGGRAQANGVAVHPNDAEAIELLRDLNGNFYFGGPGADGIPAIWRMPVVETEAVPEGTAIVADWRRAVIWDREQAGIVASDSHADFFIRNMVAILAELRAAFGVLRPAAFVTADLGTGS